MEGVPVLIFPPPRWSPAAGPGALGRDDAPVDLVTGQTRMATQLPTACFVSSQWTCPVSLQLSAS